MAMVTVFYFRRRTHALSAQGRFVASAPDIGEAGRATSLRWRRISRVFLQRQGSMILMPCPSLDDCKSWYHIFHQPLVK